MFADSIVSYIMGDLRYHSLDDIMSSKRTQKVYSRVRSCPGCFMPCEVDREITMFGFQLELTEAEVERWSPINN